MASEKDIDKLRKAVQATPPYFDGGLTAGPRSPYDEPVLIQIKSSSVVAGKIQYVVTLVEKQAGHIVTVIDANYEAKGYNYAEIGIASAATAVPKNSIHLAHVHYSTFGDPEYWFNHSPSGMYTVNIGSRLAGFGMYSGTVLMRTTGDIDGTSNLTTAMWQSTGEACIVMNLGDIATNGRLLPSAPLLCKHESTNGDGKKVMTTYGFWFTTCQYGSYPNDPDYVE
ncbi:MAG TPA: hypothetical protein VF598_01660 [Hymenobacter sp.]|jgi:hypothetical protein